MHSSSRIGVLAVFAVTSVFADVTFDESVKFTGGSALDMMRQLANNPMVSRMGGAMGAAFQDQTYTVYIKGGKMARIGQSTSTITDVDAGTITILNNEQHTYSTQTFDEMRERFEQMQQRMNRGQSESAPQFDVKVDKTGQTRPVDGQTATETIVTLTAKPESAHSPMTAKVDCWIVPVSASTREVVDYYRRLSQKFAYAFAGSPGFGSAASGINAAMKAAFQLDGYAMLTNLEVSGVSSPMMPTADTSGPFIKTETRSSNFVSGPVDDSKFEIPAGYTQQQHRVPRPQ